MATEEAEAIGVSEVIDNEWFVDAINSSMSEERLDYIAELIKLDTFDGAQYTQDKQYMQRLRAAWSARSRAIATEHSNGRTGQGKAELPEGRITHDFGGSTGEDPERPCA
jgi:hypothetical protein